MQMVEGWRSVQVESGKVGLIDRKNVGEEIRGCGSLM